MQLLTPKQESFVHVYLETGNASEAYRQAYNTSASEKTINREAAKLLDKPHIAARVEALKARTLKRHDVTVDSLLRELEEARLAGRDRGQAAAMVAATMSKAKLLGLENSPIEEAKPSAVKVVVQVQDARRVPNRDSAAA